MHAVVLRCIVPGSEYILLRRLLLLLHQTTRWERPVAFNSFSPFFLLKMHSWLKGYSDVGSVENWTTDK